MLIKLLNLIFHLSTYEINVSNKYLYFMLKKNTLKFMTQNHYLKQKYNRN